MSAPANDPRDALGRPMEDLVRLIPHGAATRRWTINRHDLPFLRDTT